MANELAKFHGIEWNFIAIDFSQFFRMSAAKAAGSFWTPKMAMGIDPELAERSNTVLDDDTP